MTITGMVRTIGKKVFSLLVALCLVGVFFSVSFAEEAGMNKTTPETPPAGTPRSAPPGKIEHAGQAAGKGIDRGADATKRGVHHAGEAAGKGIDRGVDATKRGVKRAGEAAGEGIDRGVDATKRGVQRAGEATGEGIKKAGEAIEKAFPGKDEER
ncbi:MAG: hypothetical protein WCF59_02430 [Desulfobaccales bacterium]